MTGVFARGGRRGETAQDHDAPAIRTPLARCPLDRAGCDRRERDLERLG